MNIKPLLDRVLIEVSKPKETTDSGIIIPVDTEGKNHQKGLIVAVGDGLNDNPMKLKVGDTVLFGKFVGTSLELDGKEYLMMRESEVLAII